jgi:hypothetical protein
LTFARATLLGWGSLRCEPGRGFLLGDDGEDFDRLSRDVIEHPDFTDPEPVLGLIESTQALDATPAELCWLVPQVKFDRVTDPGPVVGSEGPQAICGTWGKDDLELHLARV